MIFGLPWHWLISTSSSETRASAAEPASACCGGFIGHLIQYAIILLVIGVPLVYMLSRLFPSFEYYARITVYSLQMLGSSFFVVLLWPFMYDKEDNNSLPRWALCELLQARRLHGIETVVRGKEKFAAIKGPAVIVCNHQSSLDLMTVLDAIPTRTGIMAKKELLYVGTFGLAVRMCGGILIDRLNRDNARSTMQKLADKMRRENIKVWMFPEGTRNKQYGILPFKKGAFHLALQAHVPIIPVVISSYAPFYQRDRKILRPGTAIISVLPPISSDNYTLETVNEYADAVHAVMSDEFVKISEEAADINKTRYGYVVESAAAARSTTTTTRSTTATESVE